MKRKRNIPALVLVAAGVYLLLTAIIGISTIVAADDKLVAFVQQLGRLWWLKLLLSAVTALLASLLFTTPLDIQDVKAGHGQHGDAAFMEPEEIGKHFLKVPFGQEREPGFLVGLESKTWVIDPTDNNMMLLAPPGAGKTTGVYIPAIEYNARVNTNTGGAGASMILVDIKGTLYDATAAQLQKHGYRTPVLNLREVFDSYSYNIMYRVNTEIDAYLAAGSKKEKAIHYGMAERYAKIAASAIVDSKDKSMSSEGSEYFNESAKGLIIGLVLMVSEYAPAPARHIMSVYSLIVELSAPDAGGMLTGVQTTKLAGMMKDVTNKRIQSYIGAATSADIRTTLNIFSSALAKLVQFVDAELEQLICEHSRELEAGPFVEQPTALFIICPDENPTRHFLASLFIRTISNDLIELAEVTYQGALPRQVLYFIDEFGNLPAIPHIVSLFSAIRSRGGRILCALQSYAQLLDSYSQNKANIIRDNCQILMFSFVAPSAEGTATTLSKMLGNETILSGSVSTSKGVTTKSTQMIGRPLLSASQLVTMEKGTFITYKGTENPYQTKLKGYWEYLQLEKELRQPVPQRPYRDVVVAGARYIQLAASGKKIPLWKGMFD